MTQITDQPARLRPPVPFAPDMSALVPWTFHDLVVAAGAPAAGFSSRQLEPGETLIEPGQSLDALYVVREGQLLLDSPANRHQVGLRGGMPVLLPQLLDQVPSPYRVQAATPTQVWRIDAALVREAAAASTRIRDQVAALRWQIIGKSIARLVSDAAGATIQVVHGTTRGDVHTLHRLESRRVLAWSGDRNQDGAFEATFHDTTRGLRRTLYRVGSQLVGLDIEGPWSDLNPTLAALYGGHDVADTAIAGFQEHGQLFDAPMLESADSIVCHCSGVTRGQLETALVQIGSPAQVIAATGATKTCGGCAAEVAQIIGVSGTPMTLTQVTHVTADVSTFRFESPKPLARSKAGQHVILSAKAGDQWVHRPYTLTSAADEAGWREVAVKREPYGHMGRALSALQVGAEVRVSEPSGDFWADPSASEPAVCLVGGIGVTPALAMARTFGQRKSKRALHIEVFNSLNIEVPFAAELKSLAQQHADLTVRFHTTFRNGLPSRLALKAFADNYPTAKFYVCGPLGFTNAISGHLEGLGAGSRTFVEGFAPKSKVNAKLAAEPMHRVLRVVGALLLAAYILQGVLGVSWPALAERQATESWHNWSGVGMGTYLVFQMLLGVSRLGDTGAISRVLYRLHRYIGVLAPVLLYLHAQSFAFGYLLALSGLFLMNSALGLVDKTIVSDSAARQRWARWWLPVHISLSMLLVSVVCFHVYVTLAYH